MKNYNFVPSVFPFLLLLIFFSCKKEDEDVPNLPQITSVTITPNTVSFVSRGETAQLSAVAKDNTGQLVTGKTFTWTSSDPGVVSVNDGLITALLMGTAKITATTEGVSGTTEVSVSQEITQINIIPESHTFSSIGETALFAAEARDAGGNLINMTSIVWESTSPAIVSIDDDGNATANGQGGVIVSASANGLKAEAVVDVKLTVADIALTPVEVDLDIDETTTLNATATDPFGVVIQSPDFTWTSLNESVAIVDAAGKVTAVEEGVTFIRVSSNGINANTKVNVLPPIDLTGTWKNH